MGEVSIDAATFSRRLGQLYAYFKDNNSSLWGSSNSVCVTVGASSDDLRYLKSISLHLWLFGYELPDTIIVFTNEEVHVLTSQKKASLLQALEEPCQAGPGKKLVLHIKAKAEDGGQQMDELIKVMKAAGPTTGHLAKDKHSGKFVELFESKVAESGQALVDVSAGVADLLSVKEAGEVLNVKKAAMLASKVMKDFVVAKIEGIIDDGKSVKHSKLSELTEEAVLDPSKVGVKLKAENVDIAYPPTFQSGGKYDLRVGVRSDDAALHEGVIVVGLGTRYASYCANIARTYIINPSKQMEAEYEALQAAQEAAIACLVDGTPVSKVVDAATAALEAKGQPQLVGLLAKSLGFGMGLEFRESGNMLSAKNEGVVRAGMIFNVSVGVQGLENSDAKDARGKVYAMQVADTVVACEKGKTPEVVTSACPKTWDRVSYTLKDDEDEEEADGGKAGGSKLEDLTNAMPNRKNLRSDDVNFKSAEQLRKEKQEELTKQKNEETLRRLTAQAQGGAGANGGAVGRKVSDVVAYKSVTDMPQTRELTIQVDSRNETVLLPIYGVLVPFHITTIKSVTSNQDQDHAYIRVTFNFSTVYDPYVKFPDAIFLKELSFRSPDVRHSAKVVQDIKLLRSNVQQRDKERAERATLVQQEKLQKGKKVYKLADLWVRPTLGGKGRKVPGTLEAHANGFRYSNSKGEVLDIMYRNIKYAFFQPCEKEMVTILHFHLINPIMIGNKKCKDVQVYSEVMDVVQTLDGGRRNMYDPDEIEEEQRERDRKNRINAEFQQFVKRVQELWEKDFPDMQLEFDIPFRELGFTGVPNRDSVFMMPTVNCLVELTGMPFTVIGLEDIEIVNLERVGFNLKNFDMAVVFKDFSREVKRIDAISSQSLETIKEWLTSVKIKYYESKLNLAWKPILKNIMEDPEGFIEQGGWEFLNMDKSDSEDEGEEEESEAYQPSDEEDEEEEESSDDDSSDASLVDSDEEGDDEGEEDEDEEDEGLSWEELEEEAKREDRERELSDDSDDDRRRPAKRKGGAAPPPAAKRRR